SPTSALYPLSLHDALPISFEAALKYSQERHAFGHPISQFQAIQFMLADMSTEIDAARLLNRKAAWKQDNGARFSMDAAIAKLFRSEEHTSELQSRFDLVCR